MHHSRLTALVLDCNVADIDSASEFWSRALGKPETKAHNLGSTTYRELETRDDELITLLQQVDHPSRVHLDIETDDLDAEVARLEKLGAKRLGFVKRWWVMEAPTGHRFCVVRPQRGPLAGKATRWDEDGEPVAPPLPRGLDALMRGVYPSFALLAGMQLDLFTPLASGPLGLEALAQALGVGSARLGPLAYALVASGVLTVDREGRFANGAEADAYLVRGRERYLGAMHELLTELWGAAMQTAASIRADRPMAKIDYATTPEAELACLFRGLDPQARAAARELAARFELSKKRRLLDAGGGSGGLAVQLAELFPELEATIVELPHIAPITERFVAESPARDRVRVVAADLTQAPLAEVLPEKYDVAVMRALLQVMGPEDARRAVTSVVSALEPGGDVYALGMGALDDTRTTPPAPVAFSLVFLNLYDQGRAYTESEHRAWLTDGGLSDVRRDLRADGGSIFIARKPRELQGNSHG